MDKKWCVYLHIVHADCGYDKYYVGITSQDINKRWRNGNGYVNSPLFYKAILKYGWNNIEHEILKEELNELEAKSMEKSLIEKYKSNDRKYGYNITSGGDGTVGWHPSDETKKKISQSLSGENHPMYGKHLSEETKAKIGDGNRNKIVSDDTRKKLSKNKKEYFKREYVTHPMKGKHHTNASKEKMSKNKIGKYTGENSARSKKIYKYDLEGNYICEYVNVALVEKEFGISHTLLSRCCNDKKHMAGGFQWRYEKFDKIEPYVEYHKPSKKIAQYTKDNIFIKLFENAKEINALYNYNTKTIQACCRGNNSSAYGYIWKYV